MKLIHKFKSPNFNKRKVGQIKYIIIHYTALSSINESINYLCNPLNQVSCHYLISKLGKIYNLVDEKNRAWHAGESFWEEYTDINSMSIGIELDFFPLNQNIYSNELIISLRYLLLTLMKKYNIDTNSILGHSDIAPYRKIDPGKKFPWEKVIVGKKLTKIKLKKRIIYSSVLISWFSKLKIKTVKKRTLFMLAYIGYDTEVVMKKNNMFKKLITAYQSHHNQKKITGIVDKKTFDLIINHFLNKFLNF